MELYVLDALLRRDTVVDAFDSCVWTERYNNIGDVTLNIHSTLGNRNLLTPGTYLAMNRSKRIMKIDTVEDKLSSDGTYTLVCTGTSIENIMDERVTRRSAASGLSFEPKWILTGMPADIARELFTRIMVNGEFSPGDELPFYSAGNSYPADTIAEPSENIEISIDPGTLLAALKVICQTYDLGFRITRNDDSSQLFFNVYAGNNRTSSQTTHPPIVFAPVLDNLNNSSYLTSTKLYRNVAYVFGNDEWKIVYPEGVDPEVSGFSRRVLSVNASDISYPDRNTAGIDGSPVYVVTENQSNSIKVVQDLPSTTQLQSDSLQKLITMKRIYAQDEVNIETAISPEYLFTGTEEASILAAQSVLGIEQDQINALINLGNKLRLSSNDDSSLNTLLSNNTALTTPQKDDILAAINRQDVALMPYEIADVESALTTSLAYNEPETVLYQAALHARGLQELATTNNVTAFDGEVPQFSAFRYDVDYFLGDLVEMRNIDGIINEVRVSEQIFSQDATGEKSYPTLSSRRIVAPGVWAAWDANQEWADVSDDEHWADLD